MLPTKDLFRLVREKKWDHVIERAGIFPEESFVAYSFTFKNGITIHTLPIHIACMKNAPLRTILALIAADPKTCDFIDEIGRAPLHNAVRYGSVYRVVSVLIATSPMAAFVKAYDGALPIHLACLYATNTVEYIPIIKHLLWIHPKSLTEEDFSGCIPRDYARQNPFTGVRERIFALLDEFEAEISESVSDINSGRSDFVGFRSTTGGSEIGLERIRMSSTPYSSPYNTIESNEESRSDIHHEEESKNQSNDSIMSKTKLCVVCMEGIVSNVMVPCGHPSLCDACSSYSNMMKMKWKCPECRSNVNEVVRIFGRIAIDEE